MSTKSGKKNVGVPFEERKRKWLDKRVYEKCSQAEAKTTVPVPLKYRSLAVLARDASNEDLLRLKDIIDAERRRRPQVIEVVLKKNEYEFPYELGRFVWQGLHHLAFKKYIKKIYPNLSKDVRRELIKFAVELAEPYEEVEEGVPVSYDYDKLLTELSEEELDKFSYMIQDGELNEFMAEYLDRSPTNPHLIRVLKNLQEKEIKVSTMMLYQLELPLGSEFVTKFDDRYGEYPVINDC